MEIVILTMAVAWYEAGSSLLFLENYGDSSTFITNVCNTTGKFRKNSMKTLWYISLSVR